MQKTNRLQGWLKLKGVYKGKTKAKLLPTSDINTKVCKGVWYDEIFKVM